MTEEAASLTLEPAGPSRTAQTAVPHTMQLLHRQFCRSLYRVDCQRMIKES